MRFDAKQLREMSKSVRARALNAVRHAGSGHVGIVLGAADIVTAIYANFLRVGCDKFVLSAGHGMCPRWKACLRPKKTRLC